MEVSIGILKMMPKSLAEHKNRVYNACLDMIYLFKPYFQELEEKAWMYDQLNK